MAFFRYDTVLLYNHLSQSVRIMTDIVIAFYQAITSLSCLAYSSVFNWIVCSSSIYADMDII